MHDAKRFQKMYNILIILSEIKEYNFGGRFYGKKYIYY